MTLSPADNRKFNYHLRQRTEEAEYYHSLAPHKKKQFQEKWKSAPNFDFVEAFQNNSESFEKKSRTQKIYLTELELLGKMGPEKTKIYMEKMRAAGRFYTDVAECEWFEVEQHSKEQSHNNLKSLNSVKSSGARRTQLALTAPKQKLLMLEDLPDSKAEVLQCCF